MKICIRVLSILLAFIACVSCANLEYSGKNEIEKLNEEPTDCERFPCKNGGKCRRLRIGRSYCDCKSPFFGRYCQNHPNSCFSNPCQNNGKCENFKSNYICSCENGFTGHDCETAPDPCNPNPCKNEGICKNDNGKHKCHCAYGYTGNECETDPCNSNPCHNKRKCESYDGEYVCFCENGYTGPTCEAVDYCMSNPCQNGGSCRNGDYTFECICTEIYRGNICSENIFCEKYGQDWCGKEICQYNETAETVYCVCEIGKIFDEQSMTCIVDHCASHPCQNGGSCWNGRLTFDCICTENYRGKDCSENIWCEENGKSLCNNEKCEYDESTDSGYCVCENYKIFHEALKTCMEGVCHTHICHNGGICTEENGAAKCYCRTPFSGEQCENEGSCSTDLCHNGGICKDEDGVPTCYCKSGFSGERCERNYIYTIAGAVVFVIPVAVCFCCWFYLIRRRQIRNATACKTLPNKPI